MNVLYAHNEFKGVMIRCPHCTFSSRHDPDDIGDAIKDGKPVVCGACDKPFSVRVEVASREAVEHSVQRTCANCGASDWVTAGYPVSREYCNKCGAIR